MLPKLILNLIAALCLMLSAATALWAENRVAMIIGNSDYEFVTPLDNPGNDANDLSVALEGLGFNVFLGLDQNRADMLTLIRDFLEAGQTADVSLLFYAGHGFQVSAQNYLVPVDAQLTSVADLQNATIPLQSIIAGMEQNPGIKFVFLDACRDNPFEGSLDDTGVTVSEGLARIGNAADFMISFATQPDNVAYDGVGRNSFFTESLLSHLYTPGQFISDLMINVRKDVLAATGGRQIPWENSSLTRQFQFDPSPATVSAETLLWQVSAEAKDPKLLQLYAERYPEGVHLPEVMAFLEQAEAGGEIQSRAVEEEEGNTKADRLWELARRSRMRPLLAFYLEQYPTGKHAAAARRLIATMPVDEATNPGRLCERLATHPRDATATTAGIPYAQLAQNAFTAIQACQSAAAASPNLPHYTALLARATAAAGDQAQALVYYRDAAERGDLRALVSLGLITENGMGVPADATAALDLYERAANKGSADGMINLAVSLFEGIGIEKDAGRAVKLLQEAADLGSPIATFNLGVLAQDGTAGAPEDALDYFKRAARAGEVRGYVAAAILLDEGRGVPRDPAEAANLMLRGAAEDGGQSIAELTEKSTNWSRDTLRAVQERLKAAGHYTSGIDGRSGPNFIAALEKWRNGGFVAQVLTN
jgi:hypothetical protein